MRTVSILGDLESISAKDDDGVAWVRASDAMKALGVDRTAYLKWRAQGKCPTRKDILVPRSRKAPHGYIVALRADEVAEAYLAYRKRRRWTKAENDFVEDWHGVRSNEWIGKKLHRTTGAVAVQARKLGLEASNTDGALSPADVAKMLDVPILRVIRWVERHRSDLAPRPRKVSRRIAIKPERLLAFIDANPRIARNLEPRRIRYLRRIWG